MTYSQKQTYSENVYLWIKWNGLGTEYIDELSSEEDDDEKLELLSALKGVIEIEEEIEAQGYKLNNFGKKK